MPKGGFKTMRKTLLFIALFLLLPCTLCAEGILESSPDILKKIEKKACVINVSSPVHNQWCYINDVCPVVWDTSNIPAGGTVYLHLIQIESIYTEQEGSGYPVQNTGNYQWIVSENVGPLTEPTGVVYRIKVITPDKKCSGKSGIFGLKRKLLFPETPIPLQKK
jgi:hypothetical protein